MKLSYRDALPSDSEAIVAFYNIVGGETDYLSFEADEYPLSPEELDGMLAGVYTRPNCRMLLALDGESIVGIATLLSPAKLKSRHDAELGIVVSRAYQKLGIGTELISILIDWARGNGITTRISLETRADNLPAIGLYMRFGFVIEGTKRRQTLIGENYYDAYIMGLLL